LNRGDIWLVAGGVYASKPRPAVLIQDDRFDATDSITVCPFTSTELDAPLLRIRVEPTDLNGLDSVSWLMVDKLTTVRRANVGEQIGRITAGHLVELERLIMVFLGLAD
jgi:mRNA interferase MazF